jgi:hypothetical protein
MGPAIERARNDAISSVRFGSLAFVLGPALLCPNRKRFFEKNKKMGWANNAELDGPCERPLNGSAVGPLNGSANNR